MAQKTKTVLFNERPEGTHFKANHYTTIPAEQADKWIEAGVATEYTPSVNHDKQSSKIWAEPVEKEEDKPDKDGE